jgi:hypothetical protein
MSMGEALLTYLLAVTAALAFALIVLGIVALLVFRHELVGSGEITRPVPPSPGERRPLWRRGEPRKAKIATDTEEVIVEATGWPKVSEEEDGIAKSESVSQIAAEADARMARERDAWWEEQRAAGHSDDEIAEMEAARVVPLQGLE